MIANPFPINRVYLAHGLSEPAFGESSGTIFYVRMADGRRSIVRQDLSTGLAQVVTTEPLPAGGIGYGGGLYAVRDGVLAYAGKDNRIHGIDLRTGEQWTVCPPFEGVAAPAFSPCGGTIAFLAEQEGRCNVLLVDARGRSMPVKLSRDPWYAFNPTFSPDGTRVAWQEWDESSMPWDEARVVIARLSRPTMESESPAGLLPAGQVTIGRSGTSCAGPRFSPDGKHLAYTSDESGWRSLHVADADGSNPVRLDTGEGEIGRPDWVPGQVPIRWSDDGKALFALRRHRSLASLVAVSWPEGGVQEIPTGCTDLVGLDARAGHVVLIGSDPVTPAAVITIDLAWRKAAARASAGIGLIDTHSLSHPVVLSWKTKGGELCWGIHYPAMQGQRGGSDPRPLLVAIHGGPTSEAPLGWNPEAQYFATRGWHYLLVNYRGGTGFGRAYQDRLKGAWGVADVEDARSGAEHLVAAGVADPRRLVITGGSAGGYTTLMALGRDPDFWAAGVSLFGVGSLYDLLIGSHRFELNYEQGLIGRLPESGPLWRERSPLTHADKVKAPLLLFHGTDDKAVPHRQSVDFAEAVRKRGGIAELVSYEGEGHGFVKESTRRDQIEKMERFLHRYVICLQG